MKTFFRISFKTFKVIFKIIYLILAICSIVLYHLIVGDGKNKKRRDDEPRLVPVTDGRGNGYLAREGSSMYHNRN